MEHQLPALSEYYGVEGELSFGFYLGGATASKAGCFEPYPASEDIWLPTMSCIGYYFQPVWDDLQAPCNTGASQLMSTNGATAASQGTAAADGAIAKLVALGFQNSIAFLDIEQYNVPSGNTTCSPAVRAYVNAWVAEMHKNSYLAGVYSSPGNIAADMGPGAVANVPDQVWVALANGVGSTASLPPIPNGSWVYDQRTHQYTINYAGPYFPVVSPPIKIDLDQLDADTAYWSNIGLVCQGACTNPCNPGCPDYAPGDPDCNPGGNCDCYSCTDPEDCPLCCGDVCGIPNCGG